ncbi:GntR family transcriptional regulator [Herbaspirillum sp. alder98]|uniref:GntR family transcriptional regulator n=1 Tax=Herbaspirillum sp. alder98 TaxID=2913096 RepID=UPI001CD89B4F|nr:GntR family transcriptional regulator [Herbaspirillum sp. alder98]MCA1325619.1 GntR family transcriptional regulator [Herbaspirillum sp. alder98]
MKALEIRDRVFAAIEDKKLPPGAKINERELAEAFGVSRTIVRQALARLQEDGLVEISPKRATVVAKPSIEQAHELFDAIAMIEGAAIEKLATDMSAPQRAQLRQHVDNEHKAFENGDFDTANALARDFHGLFVGFTNNTLIIKAHSQLLRQQALITALFKTDFDYNCLQGDHMAVVDFLSEGDIAAAKSKLAAHYKLVIKGYQFKNGEPDTVDLQAIFGR